MDPEARRQSMQSPSKEAGLAEWTSQIKAMQQQVDRDEEDEQRKLEQEIAASRLARQRRSRGLTRESLDLSKHAEYASALKHVPELNDLQAIVDRQTTQADALRKLTGGASSPPPQDKKPESISLAAFMGGRATGPRLNRHAAQQDAHDPTQFDQVRATSSAPHPAFGRGGVAMPGMAPTGKAPATMPSFSMSPQSSYRGRTSGVPVADPRASSYTKSPHTTSPPSTPRERTFSTPKAAEPKVNVIAPQRTGPRDRTMSTPSAINPSRSDTLSAYRPPSARTPSPSRVPRPTTPLSPLSEGESKKPLPRSHSPASHVRESRPRTPATEQRARSKSRTREIPVTIRAKTPTRSPSPPPPKHTPSFGYGSPRSPITPSYMFTAKTGSSAIPVSSIPPQARLARPEPRSSMGSPHIPSTPKASSPAFLRAPAAKEPTPSISRLQGRGFVQNMVKASSQMSPPPSGSGGFSPSGKRQSSVLDRWPATQAVPPPAQSSPPKPTPMKKSRTIDPVQDNPSASWARNKGRVSTPAQEKPQSTPPTPSSTPRRKSFGAGSSTTMISYIKPTKTGDNDLPIIVPLAEAIHDPLYPDHEQENVDVDEHGMRAGKNVGGSGWGSPTPRGSPLISSKGSPALSQAPLNGGGSSPGKPLSHPTRDRAKRPNRKVTPSSAAAPSSSIIEPSASNTPTAPPSIRVVHSAPELEVVAPKPEVKPFVSSPEIKTFVSPAVVNVRSPSPLRASSPAKPTGRVTDRWAEQGMIIGVKPTPTRKPVPETKPKPAGMVGRVGLPGMAGITSEISARSNDSGSAFRPEPPREKEREKEPVVEEKRVEVLETRIQPQEDRAVVPEKPKDATPPRALEERRPPSSPMRHARIPSTGNRATVMDVAQAFEREEVPAPRSPSPPPAPLPVVEEVVVVEEAELPDAMSVPPARPRNATPYGAPPSLTDKRKSSMDRYSAITLPVLHEEKTPAPSPAGTLNRGFTLDAVREGGRSTMTKVTKKVVAPVQSILMPAEPLPLLPDVDIEALCTPVLVLGAIGEDLVTISVEVMSVIGTTASAVKTDPSIFYDTEVLAIVHRFKSNGLVKTEVWGWKGKRSQFGDREERKLQELAKRYGSLLQLVPQHSEPALLVRVVGGQLAIRQGNRTHWSSENTAMHLVRSSNGVILIDEHDLNIRNLCSGFCYCLSVLDTVYAWYGIGSKDTERRAALEYARGLSSDRESVIELAEGVEDGDDEMFWMILGEDDHAKADYWRWRRASENVEPRVWRVDSAARDVVTAVESFTAEKAESQVFIIDLHWELFVLVGSKPSNRDTTRLAVSVARQMSASVADARPFPPTVHTLALPSQIPADLRLAFRELDEELLNNGSIPDHMNLYTAGETFDQLRQNTFPAKHRID